MGQPVVKLQATLEALQRYRLTGVVEKAIRRGKLPNREQESCKGRDREGWSVIDFSRAVRKKLCWASRLPPHWAGLECLNLGYRLVTVFPVPCIYRVWLWALYNLWELAPLLLYRVVRCGDAWLHCKHRLLLPWWDSAVQYSSVLCRDPGATPSSLMVALCGTCVALGLTQVILLKNVLEQPEQHGV